MTLASAFEILPAIDLRGGRVVRLEQGDFGRETAYSDDPVATAAGFAESGARWLHVVDLDGARSGSPAHGPIIAALAAAVGGRMAVEVAGGLRDEATVAAALDSGATRVVVGTAALRDPTFAGRLVRAHGAARIAVALDVRGGLAVGEGWKAGAEGVDADRALDDLLAVGVATFEVTAIDRDGLLEGPDVDLYDRLVRRTGASIIASAGVAAIADLVALRAIGCRGAIVGRALYDGRIDLADAVAHMDASAALGGPPIPPA